MKIMCKFMYMLSVLLCMVSLTACSDNDEPKTDPEVKFAPLEEIFGDETWVYSEGEYRYFQSEGKEYDKDPDYVYVGKDYGLCFAVNVSTWKEYITSDADAEDIWYVLTHNVEFDRKQGYIYLDGNKEPYARVVDVQADRVVVDTHFGCFSDVDDVENKIDEGSFVRYVMIPADNDFKSQLPK